jgi:hypothetical protein
MHSDDKLTISPIQDKIITVLKLDGYLPAGRLTRRVYGVPEDKGPTRSQMESVRRALRKLEEYAFVRITKYVWDSQRCWELTGNAIPIPEKKKPKPQGLTIIK